jgi:integrase
MYPRDVKSMYVCQYRDKRGAKTPTAANRELEVLAHVFRYAVEWGVIEQNPCREVSKLRLPKRRRYVEDWEYNAVYEVAAPMMRVAMDLAILTGLRRGDLLRLSRDDIKDDGILVHTAKTGVPLLIEWSDELRAVVDQAKRQPPQVRRTIIANKQGRPYTASGFSANWQRLIHRALRDTKLKEPFRFNDLRAKSASDDSLEAATQRLGHMDSQTTQRWYRRKPARVKPLIR